MPFFCLYLFSNPPSSLAWRNSSLKDSSGLWIHGRMHASDPLCWWSLEYVLPALSRSARDPFSNVVTPASKCQSRDLNPGYLTLKALLSHCLPLSGSNCSLPSTWRTFDFIYSTCSLSSYWVLERASDALGQKQAGLLLLVRNYGLVCWGKEVWIEALHV